MIMTKTTETFLENVEQMMRNTKLCLPKLEKFMHLWSAELQQKCQEHIRGKGSLFTKWC